MLQDDDDGQRQHKPQTKRSDGEAPVFEMLYLLQHSSFPFVVREHSFHSMVVMVCLLHFRSLSLSIALLVVT